MLLLVSCDPPQMCKAPGTKGGRGAMCVKPGRPWKKNKTKNFQILSPPPFSYSDCKPECWTLTQRDHTSACLTSLPTLFPRGAPSWTNHHARHFLEVEFWVLFHRAIYVNVPSPRPPPLFLTLQSHRGGKNVWKCRLQSMVVNIGQTFTESLDVFVFLGRCLRP